MKPEAFLSILTVAGRLKTVLRHCDLDESRKESVAEHSWRLSLAAMLLRDEFPHTDIDKVIKMCIIHDLGEAFTGDIPTFLKTDTHAEREEKLLYEWVDTFPEETAREFKELLIEMNGMKTDEARLFKALDKLEAVIQHNESDISTWLPNEYSLQLTYGSEEAEFSPWLKALKAEIDTWTCRKIEEGK